MSKTNRSAAGKGEAAGAGLVDLREALAILKTSRPTFYRWVRDGKVQGVKVGRQWRFRRDEIERIVRGEGPRLDLPVDIGPLVQTLEKRLAEAGGGALPPASSSVEQAAKLMLALGYRMRASDLHITTHQDGASAPKTVLRMRVDGVLHPVAEFDPRLLPALMEEWKRMAACDVRERTRPQDGRIQASLPGAADRRLDVRVCFVPAALGESLTARFLDPGAVQLSLERLPYSPADMARIRRALRLPWGIILCTGPVGSGKTTTLYACLRELSKPEVKLMTVEDPVEYLVPWATQVQVRADLGLTFAAAARSMLRSDPDVIMIGEIRDRDSLLISAQAALTGHLVLSTLHTSSAALTLRRLVDMGLDPFLAVDSVKLVVAQRLVRKLCAKCSAEEKAPATLLTEVEAAAKAGGLSWDRVPQDFRKPVGCPECGHTGYRGRVAIAETLEITPEVADAVRRGLSAEEIEAAAVRSGMVTMAADGARRAAAGEIAWQEVLRVLRA